MTNEILDQLKSSLLALDMEATLKAVDSVVRGGTKATVEDAVSAVSDALQVVGKRFQEGDWFLSELIYAGEIAKEVMTILSPHMQTASSKSLGTVVVGTVASDIHDLGKNIFINYARSAGFNVIDLGVDVPMEKFVKAVKEHKPLALGMSCLLTSTDREIVKVIEELKKQNIREMVKVIIGGAALTDGFARSAGADAFAPDAITGTDIIKKWSVSS
jgi:methanogenic corrinoid protein MtbC1